MGKRKSEESEKITKKRKIDEKEDKKKSENIKKDKKDIKVEEENDINEIMGFKSFGSTKNKKVKGNDMGYKSVVKYRNFRQYMNRSGGFNRRLDPLPDSKGKTGTQKRSQKKHKSKN